MESKKYGLFPNRMSGCKQEKVVQVLFLKLFLSKRISMLITFFMIGLSFPDVSLTL